MLKENEVLQVRSDRLFHDLFNKEMMNTLEWTVMQILGCSYETIRGKVSVGNIRLTNTNPKERTKYVDLIIELDNEKIIIELNNNFDGNYMRNLIYAFNVIMNNYNLDNKNNDYYSKRIKVILVNLNWHRQSEKLKSIISKNEILLPYPDELSNDYLLKIINVNLDYYENKCYTEISESDKLWKLLTIDNKTDLKNFIKDEKLLESYEKKLLNLSNDKEYCEEYMNENIERNLENERLYLLGERDGEEKGIEQGIERGLEQGIKETQEKVIMNMYNNNMSLKTISTAVGLTNEEVQEIIDNFKNN